MLRTFEDYVEKKRAEKMDEGFFGMFASPLEKLIDANPAYQSLAKRYDKSQLAKIRQYLVKDLSSSGNDPNTNTGRVALNQILTATIERLTGSGKVGLSTVGAKFTAPMDSHQQQDYDGNFGRF